MPINLNTTNLIIIHYRPGAGGKFIHSCLALHHKILHLHPLFAHNKLKKKWSERKSFKVAKTFLDLTRKHQTLIEFGHGKEIYGFQYDDDEKQIKESANNFFIDLTHQTKFYFCLTNHEKNNYDIFVKAKNIFLTNDSIPMKKRSKYYLEQNQKSINYHKNYKNYFLFDMSTLENRLGFIKQVDQTVKWIGLKEIENKNLIDLLRISWLENFKISIQKPNIQWNGKGYYKGYSRGK